MWQWSQDANWWEMLRNAQDGDILMLDSRHSIQHYTFKGEGKTKLEGFYSSDGNGDRNSITVEGSLWDLYVRRPRELVGFIRWENEMPSFYLSQNVEMTQYVTQDWVILAQDATWVMAGEGVGVILTSDPYVASMLTAAAFNYLSFPDFWRSLTGTQSNDVRVAFTRTYFYQDGHSYKRHVGTMVFEQHLSNTGAGWRYTGR